MDVPGPGAVALVKLRANFAVVLQSTQETLSCQIFIPVGLTSIVSQRVLQKLHTLGDVVLSGRVGCQVYCLFVEQRIQLGPHDLIRVGLQHGRPEDLACRPIKLA